MTEPNEAWTLLAERGEWRGADDVADRAQSELHRRHNGRGAAAPAFAADTRTGAAPNAPRRHRRTRRRLPGPLVAAVAFVVVLATATASILLVGGFGESDLEPADSAPSLVPDVQTTLTTAAAGIVDTPIPESFVPMADWPTPTLDPVLALPQCPAETATPAVFPDSFFAFLGLDRSAVALTAVDPEQVAADTPMLRAGDSSLLPPDRLDGACLLTLAGGNLTAWAVMLATGEPAMAALSAPWDGDGFPDQVSSAPGEYQQWHIATGEHFNGPVSDEGDVHALTNHRLFVAAFDPDLVPEGGHPGGSLLMSLAVNPADPAQVVEPLETDAFLPGALPPGFGACATTFAFLLRDIPDGPEEENQLLVLCDTSGTEITLTAGTLPAPPADAIVTEVNGHEVAEWSSGDRIALQLSRSGLDVRLDAPPSIAADTLRAVVAAMPLATPFPETPTSATPLLGVGDGLDPSLTSSRVPVVGEDESDSERIAQVRRGEVTITLSDSMRVIQTAAFGDSDAVAYSYRYEGSTDQVTVEGADFDVPNLQARVSITQQTLPAGGRNGNPIAYVEETWGAWQVGENRMADRFQIVAYSPSIERQVNVLIRSVNSPEPLALSAEAARDLVRSVLDAIARSE